MEGNNVTVTGFGEIAEQLRRSTVLVHAGDRGSGSGMLWSAEGAVLADALGHIIGINTMVAGRLALAIPSNTVKGFLSAGPFDSWLGVTLHPVEVPRVAGQVRAFGLVVLEVEPGSPAANASLLPGDILLGTEEKPFASVDDLSGVLRGSGAR